MPQQPRELTPEVSAWHFFGAELRHWRTVRGYSQDDLGALTLHSGDTIGKVERAIRWPTTDLARRSDEILATGGVLERLLRLVLAERHRTDHQSAPCVSERTGSSSDVAMSSAVTASARTRRDVLLDSGSHLVSEEEFVMAAADQSADFAAWAEATNTGPMTVEHLHESIGQIAAAYGHGPMPLFQRTLRLRNLAFTLLEGRQRPNQTLELYAAAGWLCVLLTWLSVDLGHRDAAETQARTAWLCAELADHPTLRAWARAAQASAAYWRGDTLRAAHLAEDGLTHSATGTVPVLLAGIAATDYAQLGRVDQAEANVTRATEAQATAGSDEFGGMLTCTTVRYSGYLGSTHLSLGNHDRALTEFDNAIASLHTIDHLDPLYGTEAIIRIDAARAHLHANQIDGTIQMLQPVLTLPAGKRLDPVIQRLTTISNLLAQPTFRHTPYAINLQDQIADFRHTAATTQLEP